MKWTTQAARRLKSAAKKQRPQASLVIAIVALMIVAPVAFATPVSGASPAVSITDDTVQPGGQLAVEVSLQDTQTAKIDGIPSDWTVVDSTDDDGLFRNKVSSGDFGYELEVTTNASSVQGSISGRVTDQNNDPIPEATVTVRNDAGIVVAENIDTGPGGRYVLTVEPGTYTITAKYDGQSGQARAIVEPSTTTSASVVIVIDDSSDSDNAGLTAPSSAGSVAPGETVEITYEYTNTMSVEKGSGRLQFSTPPGVEAVAIDGDGISGLGGSPPAVFYGFSGPIEPGETRTTTVEYRVSEDAPLGSVDLPATAYIEDGGVIGTQTSTLEVEKRNGTGGDNNGGDGLAAARSAESVSPGETVKITYEYTNTMNSEGAAGRIQFSTPPSVEATTIDGDGTSGLGGSPQSVLYGFSGPIASGETLITTVEFRVSEDAALGTVDLLATAYIQDGGTIGTETTTLEIEESIVARFDDDNDGIDPGEAQAAIVALNRGDITPSEAQQIIVALNQ